MSKEFLLVGKTKKEKPFAKKVTEIEIC